MRISAVLAFVALLLAPMVSLCATDNFAIAIGDTVANGVPAAGAGNLENDGDVDVYTFAASPGQTIFLDRLSNSIGGTRVRLIDEDLTVVYDGNLVLNPGTLALTRGGTYTLSIGEEGNSNAGTYSFALVNVPTPTVFPISIGEVVADGAPSDGAGNIETPGSLDIYTFNAAPGQKIFFDRLQNGIGGVRVVLTDEDDTEVFNGNFVLDPGTLELTRGGTYTLTIGDDGRDNVGTYSFALVDIPASDMFAIAIGDTVSDGIPGAGAGNIETPGSSDVYSFTASPGQTIFFDRLENNIGGVRVVLTDEDQTEVFNGNFVLDPGTLVLTRGGTYTIDIGDDGRDNVGTYGFQLVAVPAPDSFAISIGQAVSDGVPGNGAGNIEAAGSGDVYTFTAAPGQVIFFDRTENGIGGVRVLLTDEDQTEIFSGNLILDPGRLELTRGGTYTLAVGDTGRDNTGTYAFTLVDIPAPDVFSIALGDTVADGFPGPGAGNIETAGASDIYRFEAAAGTQLRIERIENNIGGVEFVLTTPGDAELFRGNLIVSPGDFDLPETGTYMINVGSDGRDNTGTYSFSLGAPALVGTVPNPNDLEPGDRLGQAVVADGNLLVLGAPAGTDGGVVYVFRFEGSTPVFEEAIPIPDGFTAENFGASLALEGGVLVIGAPLSEGGAKRLAKGGGNVMQAALFSRTTDCLTGPLACWKLTSPIAPTAQQEDDGFGASVALSGETVIIGAPQDDEDEASGQGSGAAYVFAFDGDAFVQTAKPKPYLGQAGAGFGAATAAGGDQVAIGAPGAAIGAVLGGAVALYDQITGNLGPALSVAAPSGEAGAAFGTAIAIAGDSMLVGAPGDSSGAGSAVLFNVGGDSFVQRQLLTPADGGPTGAFGQAVALSGDRLLIGAPEGDGAAFRFELTGSTFEQVERVDGASDSGFGSAVAITGSRVAIGSPGATNDTGSATFQLLDDVVFSSGFE